MWLLDTNAWIAYLEREPNPVKTHIAERPEAQILKFLRCGESRTLVWCI